MSDSTLRKQIEELMHAQRVNDSMFEEGSEKWETNRVALIDQYEALCQEVAREAQERLDFNTWNYIKQYAGNCPCPSCIEVAKQAKRVNDIRAELTQKPAEETEGQTK